MSQCTHNKGGYIMWFSTEPMGFIIFIIITIGIILAIRELVTWYYKINLITDHLHRQEEILKKIYYELEEMNKKT